MCKKNGRNNPIKVHGNFVINGDSGTSINNGKSPLHHSQKLQCLFTIICYLFCHNITIFAIISGEALKGRKTSA